MTTCVLFREDGTGLNLTTNAPTTWTLSERSQSIIAHEEFQRDLEG